MFPFEILLFVAFVALVLPVAENAYKFIRNAFASLICLDIVNLPYSDKTFHILVKHLSDKDYHISRKLSLTNSKVVLTLFKNADGNFHVGEEFNYKDGSRGEALSFNVAMRNVILAEPDMLEAVEEIVIEKAESRGGRFLYDFAVATKDMNFSRKKLFVAISKTDPRYRNDFVRLFHNDEEIEKLASLV